MSNHESIYPAFADPLYDPATSTVAVCAMNVPLLWFALFCPDDLVTRVFETDDGPYTVVAPITGCGKALTNLSSALPRLKRLFPGQKSLGEYVRLLTGAVLRVPYDWVTIEWDEIAVITQGDFLGEVAAAMASLGQKARSDLDVDRSRLLRLSGISQANLHFPPARPLHDSANDTSVEGRLRSKIIGVGYSALVA